MDRPLVKDHSQYKQVSTTGISSKGKKRAKSCKANQWSSMALHLIHIECTVSLCGVNCDGYFISLLPGWSSCYSCKRWLLVYRCRVRDGDGFEFCLHPHRQLGPKRKIQHLVALTRCSPSTAILHPLHSRGGVLDTGCHLDKPSIWWLHCVGRNVTLVHLPTGFVKVWRLRLSLFCPSSSPHLQEASLEAFRSLFHNILCSLCQSSAKKKD